MNNTTRTTMNAEIKNEIDKFIETMTKKHPETADIELQLLQGIQDNQGNRIRKSEIDNFKQLAMSSMGTDKEMAFKDVEAGFLQAALMEGRNGLKEYLESLPLETPVDDSGKKHNDRGKEKKTS